jgi:hypothetical protein
MLYAKHYLLLFISVCKSFIGNELERSNCTDAYF